MRNRHAIFPSALATGVLLVLMFTTSCDSAPNEAIPEPGLPIVNPPVTGETRAFNLGFTPWPYAATQEANDWTYAKTEENSDIVSHHLEEGVPWPEMLANQPFSGNLLAGLQDRKSKVKPWQKVLLSI